MHILFVSSTDVCRGPMARVIAERQARDFEARDALFDSAGINAPIDVAPPYEVVEFLRNQGYSAVGRHRSKPLDAALLRWADLILCMTEQITNETRTLAGVHRAKVLLLNSAVGFGKRSEERDVPQPGSAKGVTLMTTLAQLRAATGKLCRRLSDGEDRPEDFGAEVVEDTGSSSRLADPKVREFLSRYLIECIERSPEPPSTATLCEGLERLGRPLSMFEVEELLNSNLRGRVRKTGTAWAVHEASNPRPGRPGSASPGSAYTGYSSSGPGANTNTNGRASAGAAGPDSANGGPKAKPSADGDSFTDAHDSADITDAEAFEVLSISKETPYGEAQSLYRKLLMRYHPDKFHDDEEFRKMAESKTKRINAAWALIRTRLPEAQSQ